MGKKEQLFNYDFETDDVTPTYVLGVHVRNIRNEYLVKAFKSSLTEANALAAKKSGSLATAKDFVSSVDNIVVPERFFNSVRTAVRKMFRQVRGVMESKHDIVFVTWNIDRAFFYRNPQDTSEWILGVIYKGDYSD